MHLHVPVIAIFIPFNTHVQGAVFKVSGWKEVKYRDVSSFSLSTERQGESQIWIVRAETTRETTVLIGLASEEQARSLVGYLEAGTGKVCG